MIRYRNDSHLQLDLALAILMTGFLDYPIVVLLVSLVAQWLAASDQTQLKQIDTATTALQSGLWSAVVGPATG
jgi:hypothetical protein